MGMSSPEWSKYMHDEIGLSESPEEINAEVVRRMLERYRESLPLLDGAVAAVRRLAPASTRQPWHPRRTGPDDRSGARDGRNRRSLRRHGLVRGGGARSPRRMSLEAARRLGVAPPTAPRSSSANGIRSAHAAGMRVLAIPNTHYPPAADVLALADAVVGSPDELTPALVRG